MSTGTAVNTGDTITAAKMNLKQEDGRDLAAVGVLDQSGVGGQELVLVVSENLSADRNLTLIVNDAARTIDLTGNLTLAAGLTTTTAAITLAANAAGSSVTLPASGTLATLAGTENLSNKTLVGTVAGTPTFSGATITFTGGTIALTGGAAYTLWTTDAFNLQLGANGANRLIISSTLGDLIIPQATGNVTLRISDPAAARVITFPDPVGDDSVMYLAATQTVTNKTLTNPTINAAALSGNLTGTPSFTGATLTHTGATLNFTAAAAYTLGTTDNNNVQIKANNANRLIVSATLGDLIIPQTGGNVTVRFADPGAARVITVADPGGAATLAYINQAQTFTVAHIFTGTPILRSTVAATTPLTVENTNDAASVLAGVIQGDRATPADNDAAYVSLRLSDSGGTQDEQARISWVATTVAAGATQDGDLVLSALNNDSLLEFLRMDGSEPRIWASRLIFGSLAGNAIQLLNTTDGASVQVGIFEGDRATPADNDAAYLTLRLSDSAGTQTEMVRLTWLASDVTVGTNVDAELRISTIVADVLTYGLGVNGRSLVLPHATGNYTVTWSDPAAGRTLNIADPLGNDTFVFLGAAQTITGKTLSLSGDLTFSAALDIELQANTTAALEINSTGVGSVYTIDTRTATDGVIAHIFDAADPTFASAAGSSYSLIRYAAFTLTLTGGTGVTALNGLAMEFQAPTVTSAAATTITTASTVFIRPITAAGAGPASITNSRMIDTSVAGCFLTAAGVWTDACSIEHKTDVESADLTLLPKLLSELDVVTYRRKDVSDGGFTRYGVIAETAPDCLATGDHKGIAANYMGGLALAAIKWLREQNEKLESRIAELELKLNAA